RRSSPARGAWPGGTGSARVGDAFVWSKSYRVRTMRRGLRVTLVVLGGLIVVAALAAGAYVINNVTYFSRGMRPVSRAGFVEKQATIDGARVHYAEGPANGPPLLLIHGQSVDWKNYYPVLPALAQ